MKLLQTILFIFFILLIPQAHGLEDSDPFGGEPLPLIPRKAVYLAGAENRDIQSKSELMVKSLPSLSDEFKVLRNEFELVYGKTRILTKPDNYILDQDHHSHLANQTKSFDWQFYAEILVLEKIGNEIFK